MTSGVTLIWWSYDGVTLIWWSYDGVTLIWWSCGGVTLISWSYDGVTLIWWSCDGVTLIWWSCDGVTLHRWCLSTHLIAMNLTQMTTTRTFSRILEYVAQMMLYNCVPTHSPLHSHLSPTPIHSAPLPSLHSHPLPCYHPSY